MRIGISLLSFNPQYAGGTSVFAKNLIENLVKIASKNEYLILVDKYNKSFFEKLLEPFIDKPEYKVQLITLNYNKSTLNRIMRFSERCITPKFMGRFINLEGKALRNKIESLNLDIIHFPLSVIYPYGLKAKIILNPHDIQHEHYPENFSKKVLLTRRRNYLISCKEADRIIVASKFIKDDLTKIYKLNPKKIEVIELAPNEIFQKKITTDKLKIRKEFRLPKRFIFYPAQIWPHKNHKILLDSLHILKEEKRTKIPLVLTGKIIGSNFDLKNEISKRELEDQVYHLGNVEFSKLPVIYDLAEMLVFPSLFEASSFPIMEAFARGIPVLASEIPPLLELAKGYAIFFDPKDPYDISKKIYKIWNNSDLRDNLSKKSRKRSKKYNWERVIKEILEVYRGC